MFHLPSHTQPAPLVSRRAAASALLAGLAWTSPARADDAQKTAQTVFDRPNGRDLTTLGRMELVERGRAPRIRELVTYRLDRGNGETVTLMRFLEPRDIAGTGLLSVARADGSNDQSLYLPELDRVRRVAGERKGGRFVGSDLYYEDLQERRPTKDRHRLLGRETVSGVACEVLESLPLDANESVYTKRVSWLDMQTLMALRIDLFERDDAGPSKRWTLQSRKRVQGYWTAMDSRMTDLSSGHETRLIVEHAVYDRKLPARLFTAQALADENLESEYRP